MTISNDGATIMKKLEIVHPAAKTLVDISLSQDAEVCALRRVVTSPATHRVLSTLRMAHTVASIY